MAGFLVGGLGTMAFVQGDAGSMYRPLHGGIFTTADATESPNGETLVDAAYTGLTLRCSVSVNTNDVNDTLGMQRNQGSSSLLVTITANTTGEFSDTSSQTISSGDDISFELTLGDLGHDDAITLDWWTFEYSGTGDSTWIAAGGAALDQGVTDAVCPMHNGAGLSATTTGREWETAVATALDQLHVVVTQNNVDNTSTADIEEDGTAGAQQVSITANTTGLFSDLSGTDDIDADDNLRWSVDVGAGMGGDTLTIASLSVRSSADAYTALATTGGSVVSATTGYWPVIPTSRTLTGADATTQVPVEFAETVDRGAIGVTANARTTTTTFTLRDDGVDTDIVLSVSAATTGLIQDLSNSHAFVADDLINWEVVSGSGTETLTWAYLSVDDPQQAAPIDPAVFAGMWPKGQQEPIQTLPEVVSYG